MCLFQSNLKRLLAFVTISQIGLALIGVALLTPAGLAGAALLVPADGLIRAGLFVCLGILIHRCASVHELHLRGRGSEVPRLVAALFVAGAMGLAALPFVGAFSGKALVEDAAADVGYGWIAAVFVAATVLTSGALLRAAGRIFLGHGAGPEALEADREESEFEGAPGFTPPVVLVIATILILAGLVFASLPGFAHHIQDAAAHSPTGASTTPPYSASSTGAACRASRHRCSLGGPRLLTPPALWPSARRCSANAAHLPSRRPAEGRTRVLATPRCTPGRSATMSPGRCSASLRWGAPSRCDQSALPSWARGIKVAPPCPQILPSCSPHSPLGSAWPSSSAPRTSAPRSESASSPSPRRWSTCSSGASRAHARAARQRAGRMATSP